MMDGRVFEICDQTRVVQKLRYREMRDERECVYEGARSCYYESSGQNGQ